MKREVFVKKVIILVISQLGIAGSIQVITPLVDVARVKANAGKLWVVFVDLRWNAAYLSGHVPSAIRAYFGKDSKREKNADGIMGMIPSTNILAKLIGEVWASEITIKYVSLEVYLPNFDRTSLRSFDYFAKSIFWYRTFCTNQLLQNWGILRNKLIEFLVILNNFKVNESGRKNC